MKRKLTYANIGLLGLDLSESGRICVDSRRRYDFLYLSSQLFAVDAFAFSYILQQFFHSFNSNNKKENFFKKFLREKNNNNNFEYKNILNKNKKKKKIKKTNFVTMFRMNFCINLIENHFFSNSFLFFLKWYLEYNILGFFFYRVL